jgi:hypothetical protein
MSELERIVRPFAGFPASPGQAPLTPPAQPETENVRLEIGKDAGTKTYNGSFSANISRYMDERVDKLTTSGVNGQKTNTEFKNKK